MASQQASDEPRTQSERRLTVFGTVLYLLIACWMCGPLASNFFTWVPIGTEEVRTVPMFNAWTLWWNADRALHGFSGYWDAPIFFPEKNTFAFSEPQPLTLMAAPIYWLTGSAAAAYNFYYLASLTLNGLFAQRLLRTRNTQPMVAVGGGIAMVLLPVVQWQSGVVQLVPLWGILWTWTVLARMLQSEEPQSVKLSLFTGLELGLAFTVTCYAAVHHALFLSVLLTLSFGVFYDRVRSGRFWYTMAAAACVVLLTVGPLLIHLQQMTEDIQFERPRDVVSRLSLRIDDYIYTFGRSLFSPNADIERYWPAGPGSLKLIMAAAGIACTLCSSRHRRWGIFLSASGGAAFIFSLGTNAEAGFVRPWEWLTSTWPGFAQVRSAFRFVYFVQMIVVLFAAEATAAGLRSSIVKRPTTGRESDMVERTAGSPPPAAGRWQIGCVLMCGLAAMLDPLPPAQRFGVFPDFAVNADWLEVLRKAEPRGAVLFLPTNSGEQVRDFEPITEWMLLSSRHGLPLVNGYSGFFPPDSLEFFSEAATKTLSPEQARTLFDQGVRYVAVDRSRYAVMWAAESRYGSLEFRKLISSPSGTDVYAIIDAKSADAPANDPTTR